MQGLRGLRLCIFRQAGAIRIAGLGAMLLCAFALLAPRAEAAPSLGAAPQAVVTTAQSVGSSAGAVAKPAAPAAPAAAVVKAAPAHPAASVVKTASSLANRTPAVKVAAPVVKQTQSTLGTVSSPVLKQTSRVITNTAASVTHTVTRTAGSAAPVAAPVTQTAAPLLAPIAGTLPPVAGSLTPVLGMGGALSSPLPRLGASAQLTGPGQLCPFPCSGAFAPGRSPTDDLSPDSAPDSTRSLQALLPAAVGTAQALIAHRSPNMPGGVRTLALIAPVLAGGPAPASASSAPGGAGATGAMLIFAFILATALAGRRLLVGGVLPPPTPLRLLTARPG